MINKENVPEKGSMQVWKDEFDEVEKEHPGFYKFLDDLKLGSHIKFYNLFKKGRDQVIQVIFREEFGDRGRAPGCGCIEYANILEDGSYSPLHEDGYYPCQTFLSMRDWFRYSDSYEIVKEWDGKMIN